MLDYLEFTPEKRWPHHNNLANDYAAGDLLTKKKMEKISEAPLKAPVTVAFGLW